MEFLERERYLAELENLFSKLPDGNGFVVLVSGEAGIGKTTLVENFTKKIDKRARILWGTCDALFAPRPLGPLYDISAQLKNDLINLLNSHSERSVIFSKFLSNIQESKLPNIIIIEDVHWADELTFDLIKYLGRRANKINSILIITYRHDEISSEHPLRFVLGDIPSQNLVKIKLPVLSENMVNVLAEVHGLKNLFKTTGGNPFLISEMISNKDEGIPSSIKDSILARMSRLSSSARELIEFVSIIPTSAELWLIDKAFPYNSKFLDECYDSGIIYYENNRVLFKHELTRLAVEGSLSLSKKLLFNEKVLQIFLKQEKINNYLARIIHHAEQSHNKKVIIKYAPIAAKQASKLGAHLLAANHYKNVLRFADELSIQNQLDFYESKSYECYLNGKVKEGIEDGVIVLNLLKKFPDPIREGENYRRISRMLWYDCNDEKAEQFVDNAIEILEKLPPGKELAMAYSNKSQTYMLREETELAIKWGEKAVKLARKMKDKDIEAHALNNIGTAKMFADDITGEEYLKKSLQISLKNDFVEQTTRAYINLGCVLLQKRELKKANEYFAAGTEYCSDKDLHTLTLCMLAHHANVKLYLGEWDSAVEFANSVFQNEYIPEGNKNIPLFIIGIIRARRNDPGAMNLLAEANRLSLNLGEMDKIVTIKAATAEAFWLQNKLNEIADEIESLYFKIQYTRNPWYIGSLAYWLWKNDRLKRIPKTIAKPYLLQINGDWKSAAKLWEELECPYEKALALSEGDERAMKEAIDIFNSLGASATSQLVKQKMRESGIKSIPKGPRKTTKANPNGLTVRQVEVLNLVSKGFGNNEIGNKLFISPKTVDHHISAILLKLNVHSRYEAADFIRSYKNSKK
jgi:DNA-binding CsgD family transcriptional regulator/tetratricopeptide (TPR) repeat protein